MTTPDVEGVTAEILPYGSDGLPKPIDWADFWTRERLPDWQCEPVIPTGKLISVVADRGAGKSESFLYIAACLATGRRVLDQRAGAPIDVIYIDKEMTEEDLEERLTEMGFGPETDLSHLHYYLLPELPPLDTPEGGQKILAMAWRDKAKLVIIDTIGRVLQGKENESDTYIAFFQNTGQLLKLAGVTVVRLDHTGKDHARGPRGTSAKRDDVDLEWTLTKQEGGTKLQATKRRQGWIPEHVNLVRLEEPALRYEMAAVSWPAGTPELAAMLDELDIPLEWGAKKVRPALRTAGKKARNDALGAAIRYRKQEGYQARTPSGTPSGTPSQTGVGTPNGDTPPLRYGDTLGDTRGHPATERGGVSPSLGGDTPHSPAW
jgi:AAA domain-containing protein